MTNIKTKGYSLRRLARLFDRRVFAVPELQREFVWNARKACQLLDSIYAGYPIGSALVWKTDRRNQTLLRKTLHILPPFDDLSRDILFLVDGQQRLSVLWQVLRGSGHEVRNSAGALINFGDIYFYAGTDPDEEKFVYRRRPPSHEHVPVVDVLSSRWRSRIGRIGKRATARAVQCRERILGYTLWLTFMETRDLGEVRETFIRINSQGTRIGAADRAFARASSFDLRHLVHEVRESLACGFDAMQAESILMTVALVRGAADIGERAIDAMVRSVDADTGEQVRFHRTWHTLKHSIGLAVDYLVKNFGIANYGFLPSEYLVTVLAQYFFHKGNTRPSRPAQRELRRWFWATVVGTRYTGRGHRPNILEDVRFMRRLAHGAARFAVSARTPLRAIRYAEYARRSMLTDGYFCLLRLMEPRYLEDGEPIPVNEYSTRANRNDKHHIFPRQLLVNRGYASGDYNSIANICFLVARENQSIGSRPPHVYLEQLPHGRRARNQALRSHLIPWHDESGLWEKNARRGFRRFVAARAHENREGIRGPGGNEALRSRLGPPQATSVRASGCRALLAAPSASSVRPAAAPPTCWSSSFHGRRAA